MFFPIAIFLMAASAEESNIPDMLESKSPTYEVIPMEHQTNQKVSIPAFSPISDLRFSSHFGTRNDPFTGRRKRHSGVDIPSPKGTPIYATADGIVSYSGIRGGYGKMVEINHGAEITTRYAHMSEIVSKKYARVKRGDIIGLVGSTGRSTGPHLHYEIRIDGVSINPSHFLDQIDTKYIKGE